MLVLAGPGSGKTSVLISRLQQLTERQQIDPQSILVVTFTRAAAKEMKDRYLHLCGSYVSLPVFGTLHSVFFSILRRTEKTAKKQLLAGEDKRKFIYTLLGRLGQDPAQRKEQAKILEQEISAVRRKQMPPEQFVSEALQKEAFLQAYAAYQRMLSEMRVMDFDDLAMEVRQLFLMEPSVYREWQERFSHILVDEFQDIDAEQYELLKMLAAPQNNLYMVGDDDQSIYGFRGADPEVMQRVPRDFPDLETVVLDTNYRCGKRIIDCAGQLIRNNRVRYEKETKAAKKDPGEVTCLSAVSRCRQWQLLAEDIHREIRKGREPKEIAVLTRTVKGGQGIRMLLAGRGIACQGENVAKTLAEHPVWKDIEAYLAIAEGNTDRRFYLTILNKPVRYLPRACLTEPQVDLLRLSGQADPVTAKGLSQLHEELLQLKGLVPAAALYCIRRYIGYERYLEEAAGQYGKDQANDLVVLEVLQQLAAGKRTFAEFAAAVRQFAWPTEKNGVMVSTLHASKGLEYEAVYIPDLNEGNLPRRQARGDAAVEEERRLLYVGMTRAKEKLVLAYTDDRSREKDGPSRFLYEAGMSI